MIQNIRSKCNIAVIGDLILDKYTFGDISRISPEAPVPVMKILRRDWRLGGSGNVILNLKALEMQCFAFGRVGQDRHGEIALSLLDGVVENKGKILVSKSVPTITKNRVVANNQQVVRLDEETVESISAAEERAVLSDFAGIIDSISAVVLSDYGKGFLTKGLLRGVIDMARARGLPVVVDPKGSDFSIYKGATVITPNNKEAALAAPSSHGLEETARALLDQAGLDFLMITRGPEGISYFRQEPAGLVHQHYPPVTAKSVIDVTGAGDTVVAVTAMCLANGIPHHFLCRFCNIAAGHVVGLFGAATISLETLRGLVMPAGGKSGVKSLADIAAYVAARQAGDSSVVYADILGDAIGAEDIQRLRLARERGDVLVVGIPSDKALQAANPGRAPRMSQADRLKLVSEFRCVDLAFITENADPAEVTRALKPDLVVVNKSLPAGAYARVTGTPVEA